MRRMGAHQPLQDRLERLLLLLGIIEEAQRSPRIHQRVLADEVLDFPLGVLVERVVGGAHVGEFGVAALRIDDARRQQREFRRNGSEGRIGMPQAIAEVEQVHPAVARQRLAVLVEVGDVVQAGG